MDHILKYYNQFDEWGRLDREPIEFLVNLHYITKYLPPHGHILDNGAGPGKYAMELAKRGYDMSLTDLTPRLVEVAYEKAKDFELLDQFKAFKAADARNLDLFEDEQFDASLMLGPLYHLQEKQDRNQAVKELYRVTKSGGVVFAAFMTRTRHLTTSLLYPQHWKPNDNIHDISTFMETGIFNHSDEGRFTGAYYFNIDEIQPFMESHGFESIQLIASSSIAGSFQSEQFDYWRSRGDDEFREVMEVIYKEAGSPYILGMSSHLLYIGRRK
ncbi:MAG: class I SAM-dependent methyltransferase [Bacillota bacterium]